MSNIKAGAYPSQSYNVQTSDSQAQIISSGQITYVQQLWGLYPGSTQSAGYLFTVCVTLMTQHHMFVSSVKGQEQAKSGTFLALIPRFVQNFKVRKRCSKCDTNFLLKIIQYWARSTCRRGCALIYRSLCAPSGLFIFL